MFAQHTSRHVPVLRGVGDGRNELHSFGVVVNLSVQAEVLLDKIIRGHELLTVLVHHAGILARRQTAPSFKSTPQFSGDLQRSVRCLFTQVTRDM